MFVSRTMGGTMIKECFYLAPLFITVEYAKHYSLLLLKQTDKGSSTLKLYISQSGGLYCIFGGLHYFIMIAISHHFPEFPLCIQG